MGRVLAGKVPNDFFAYLADIEQLLNTSSGATSLEEFLQPDHI